MNLYRLYNVFPLPIITLEKSRMLDFPLGLGDLTSLLTFKITFQFYNTIS